MVQEYGRNFQIIKIGESADERHRHLTGLLANEDGDLDPAAVRLCELLKKQCASVVKEVDYIDADFKSSFSRFYYSSYRDIAKRCTRLHFFSSPLSTDDLYDFYPLTDSDPYLGFVVLRPLPAHKLGRAILTEKLLDAAPLMPEAAHERKFLTCRAKYAVNLAGNTISFWGSPWMQQDTMVSACASVSLWCANYHMSARFAPEFRFFTTPKITDLASQYSLATGRAMPSEGLTVEQMTTGLKAMGFEPILRFPKTGQEAMQLCYQYVESSIPVILIISYAQSLVGHAVTLVGHTMDLAKPRNTPDTVEWSPLSFLRSSAFVPRFVVQDDTGGPFRFLELLDWPDAITRNLISKAEEDTLRSRYRCVVALDDGTEYKRVGFLRSALVPLPPRVTLGGRAAERGAVTLLRQWFKDHPDLPYTSLVLRTLLQPSNSLKSWWHPRNGIPADLGLELRCHAMSKWVWFTELCSLERLQSDAAPVLGQIIQDSAGNGATPSFFDILAFSVPGALKLGLPNGKYLRGQIEYHGPYAQYVASVV